MHSELQPHSHRVHSWVSAWHLTPKQGLSLCLCRAPGLPLPSIAMVGALLVETHTCSLLSSCPHHATSIPAPFASHRTSVQVVLTCSFHYIPLLFSNTSLSSCFPFSEPSQLSFPHPLSQGWFCCVQSIRPASITCGFSKAALSCFPP